MTERRYGSTLFYAAFVASAAFVAGGWWWAWSALRNVSGPLILHFSDYNGINQIGSMAEVHGLGASALLIVIINFVLARALRTKEPRWAGLLAAVALFAAILLFTSLAAIISVNK